MSATSELSANPRYAHQAALASYAAGECDRIHVDDERIHTLVESFSVSYVLAIDPVTKNIVLSTNDPKLSNRPETDEFTAQLKRFYAEQVAAGNVTRFDASGVVDLPSMVDVPWERMQEMVGGEKTADGCMYTYRDHFDEWKKRNVQPDGYAYYRNEEKVDM